MKKIYKICIGILIIEIIIAYLVFFSGIIIPFISQTVGEFNVDCLANEACSYTRSLQQELFWTLLHFPLSFVGYLIINLFEFFGIFLSSNFVLFGVFQYPLLLVGINKLRQS